MDKPLSELTRNRLLHAGGEVFAERGFRTATVREICRRAKVNIASVNYHFSSKEELYASVLEYAYQQASSAFPNDPGATGEDTPERRLHNFIRNFLSRLLYEGRPAWYGMLMAREIVEPTGALDRIIERAIRPLHESLAGIVRDIVGEQTSGAKITRCVLSILGQCLFYRHARPVIARLHPSIHYEDKDIERTAAHIAEFTLAALRHLSKQGRKR
ncbi:MAG: CerR family C-terminal domain-containing protein [Deltaproteobacteria bacterium]|nr:CerR family C-terminal domain-containing protein [Deltaproteobacteria bacterium]